MKNPLVSIVIPVFNRPREIMRAMDSVYVQTLKDYEIIIVDDYSTDKTSEWLEDLYRMGADYWLFRTGKNSGSPVIPRNYGVRQARGQYVAFLDSDDWWHPNKLEAQVGFMQVTGGVLSFHDLIVEYPTYNEQWSRMSTPFDGRDAWHFLLKKNFIPTSSVMMVREYYQPMDMSLDVSHDWDLWLKIAYEYPIYYLGEVLGVLTMGDGSVITEVHKRRKESRRVIRRWMQQADGMWYRKVMLYYYLMELFDILPRSWQGRIRARWYNQKKYLK